MEWTCRCGAFAVEVEPKGGTRAVCYCRFCQDFARRTDAEDTLDPQGGSDLYQVAPEAARILRGREHLTWIRLSDKGPCRWHTTCCNTAVANTLESPKIPFLTLMTPGFARPDDLGPVAVRVFRGNAKGRVPDDAGGVWRLYRGFARRAIKSRLSGGWRENPFFDEAGRPIAEGRRVAD